MVYVECKADLILVKSILSKRKILHAGDKAGVCRRLQRQRNCKGLVDEDPSSPQPPYLRKLKLDKDLTEEGLKVLFDERCVNYLIVLCPRLEEWIFRAAEDINLKIEEYSLPGTPEKLHRVINLDLNKFKNLLNDLEGSKKLRALKELLEE